MSVPIHHLLTIHCSFALKRCSIQRGCIVFVIVYIRIIIVFIIMITIIIAIIYCVRFTVLVIITVNLSVIIYTFIFRNLSGCFCYFSVKSSAHFPTMLKHSPG